MALSMYTQDYDDRFLPRYYTDYTWTGIAKNGIRVYAPLQPYLRSPKVMICPSDGSFWFATGGKFATSYAWSEKLGDTLSSSVLYPARVVTFNEIWSSHMHKYGRCYDPHWKCLGSMAGNEAMLVFVDGHVKYTRSIGTNTNPREHDWRIEYYNVRPDEFGQNTYDVK